MFSKPQPTRIAGAIEIYDDIFSDCEHIVNIVTSNQEWEPARTGTNGLISDMRTGEAIGFDLLSFRASIDVIKFGQTIYQYLDDYGHKYKVGFSNIEPANLNRYMPGQEYKAHADDGPELSRVISALIYMNDVEDGGETYFPLFDITVKPKMGRLVIFPSNYAYLHEARPPKSGIKYSVAVWAIK